MNTLIIMLIDVVNEIEETDITSKSEGPVEDVTRTEVKMAPSKMSNVKACRCSAHFCHLNHFCHSSPVLSIHINRFCQHHHFCQLLSTQSSPVLSTTSTTYVATDEVTTFVNKARLLLSTVMYSLSTSAMLSHNLK